MSIDEAHVRDWDEIQRIINEDRKPRYPNVDSPAHYTYGTIESIQAIEASMEPAAFKGFCKGNVLKYMWRYERKNGVEDLRKASWYLKRLIEAEVMNESN